MNQSDLTNLLNQQNQDPQKAAEKMKKQQEMEERRKVMLQNFMTNKAKERLNRLGLVKPEKAKQIEDMIIQNGSMGVYKEKISEEQLIAFLEGMEEQKMTVQFKRKIGDDDDDIDIDGI